MLVAGRLTYFSPEVRPWEKDWVELNLPEGLHDVLTMMGDALHDTIQAPEIAKNFGCLPEQLLERLRQLPDSRNAMAED